MVNNIKEDKHLLFFGELPPQSLHGIAISNKINLDLLKFSYIIDTVEEVNDFLHHGKNSIKKIVNFFINNFTILKKSLLRHYKYFYLIYSLSTSGSFKTLSAIIIFRIFNRGEIVLHIHRGDFFSRYYKSLVNRILSKIIIGLSHKIIVLSDIHMKEFEAIYKRNFFILSNTIETEHPVEIVPKEINKFIYISNYLLDKGIIDLLEVFSRLSEKYHKIILQTFGAFSDNSIKEKILNFNSENIKINGIIHGINKFKQIAQSGCLILPSWNEGQPIVLLEAMSLGTPVIASNVGLIPEMLGFNYPYLTIPANRDSLEEKLIQFIEHGESYSISKYLSQRYSDNYSQKGHYETLLRIFV